MSNKDTLIFTLVAVLFFIVTFVGHWFYREYAFVESVNDWIPRLQYYTNGIWARFNHAVHWFGWEILWAIVVAFYAKFNRASSAFLLTSTSKFIALIAGIKMFWNDPAPYMDKDFIEAKACDQNTFQTPSLEVALAAFVYSMIFYLAYDWIDVVRPRVKRNDRYTIQGANNPTDYEDEAREYFLHESTDYQKAKESDFTFWFVLTFILFGVFLIAFSSMYLGLNTLDQVVYAMFIGYGAFCVIYFFVKDWATQKYILISEKMIPLSQIVITSIQQLVFTVLLIVLLRVYYSFQVDGFTVNPKWKSEHLDDCGVLPFPSFFDKEMGHIYNFLYLDLGIIFGLFIDSILIGGTRVDYNQLRESEERNALVGFLFRYIITVAWVLLTIWGLGYLLQMLVHHWLFVLGKYRISHCGFNYFKIQIFESSNDSI